MEEMDISNIVSHLSPYVFERGGVDEREAYEEHVGLWVGERPQSVVVLLPRSIPETQVDRLAIHHHVRGVVVESGDFIMEILNFIQKLLKRCYL